MDNNISYDIEQIKNKKMVVLSLEEVIEGKRKAFEEEIKPLIDMAYRKKNEISILCEKKVSVRLGDLLDELSKLSGIKVSDIDVEIETGISLYGKYTLGEILKLMGSSCDIEWRTKDDLMYLDLFGCGDDYLETCKPLFEYYALLPFKIDEIQDDGMKLIEHCEVKYGYDDRGGYTKIIVNRDIENIICNFNLGYIERVSDMEWYPADLFQQAIINCVERENTARVDKIRKRVK